MKTRLILAIACLIVFSFLRNENAQAQNTFPATGSAGIGTTSPKASALLDMESTTKGFLPPQMTQAQRLAIASPAAGLIVYQTNGTGKGLYYYTGSAWKTFSPWSLNGSNISFTSGNVGIGNSSPAYALDVNGDINQSAGSVLRVGSKMVFKYDSALENTWIGGGGSILSSGRYNTGIGYQSLYYNTSGDLNTATGLAALQFNTSGTDNTATGAQALLYNTSGGDNTATGLNALIENTTGSSNTATGGDALDLNKTGSFNVAIGNYTLFYTAGSSNTGVGANALFANTTGNSNVAIGVNALLSNKVESNLVAVGDSALYNSNGGLGNTAIGSKTLFNTTTGSDNTALGYLSLFNANTAISNTAVGDGSLYNTTTGTGNTSVGSSSGYLNTTGSDNTTIGFDAYPTPASTLTNYTGIGFFVGTAASGSNMVELGNSSVTVIRGEVGFSTYSDLRIKKNIKQNVPGLKFINLLKPVTYNVDEHKENEMLYAGKTINGKSADIDYPAKYDIEKQQMTGFIAQDVESAAETIDYNFSGVVKPQTDKDLYSLRYSDFVVPLVKAVQELSTENDSLKNRLTIVEVKLNLATTTGMVKVSINNPDQTTLLGQNIPNPFDHSTLIPFRIPSDCHDASIAIVETATGKIIHLIPVSCTETQLSFDAGSLASGNYSYSLYVDGKLVETKQMVIEK